MAAPPPSKPSYTNRALVFIATGFGSGYLPKAPGTFGSLVGLLIAWPLLALPLPPYLLATAACCALGVVAAGVAERRFGVKDPGAIVIDEIAGILVTLIAVTPTLPHLLLGFALFRLFDITKPFPCRWAERRLGGGLGVMADDILAGIYAAAALHLTLYLSGW
ncbi:MAG: phosphatidylglycerophosphatase A [Nitrospirae bacterium]|nr:phosphatidylglycerophosphatase A [Nitrospirota bacterium]